MLFSECTPKSKTLFVPAACRCNHALSCALPCMPAMHDAGCSQGGVGQAAGFLWGECQLNTLRWVLGVENEGQCELCNLLGRD